MDQIEKDVIKSGLTWVEFSVGRTSGKLDIWVKALPEVEKVFKDLGKNRKEAVEAYGKEWTPLDKGTALLVYSLDTEPSPTAAYTLMRPGMTLLSNDGRNNKFNLSFLRLVGISRPEGIRFSVSGPCTKGFVKDVADLVLRETNKFLYDHVVPVQINLRITSQEV